jgi:predicted ester cyclase
VTSPRDIDEVRLAHRQRLGEALMHPGSAARERAVAALYSADCAWYGPKPLDGLQGAEAITASFWRPLFEAIPDIERREDISLAGAWNAGLWTAVTGHYQGRFVAPWLGLPPNGRLVRLRFGEFSRLDASCIVEQYTLIDLPDLMWQLGCWPFAPMLGSAGSVPGPREHDGLICGPQDPDETRRSLQLVEAMIAGLMRYDRQDLDSMDQASFWTPRFSWYGPAGIGSCRGQDDYRRVHQKPFLTAFPDRKGGDHRCRIAEGRYVASTGWPSIRATHLGGGFMGLPPTGRPITMRVMDFWKRSDSLLDENWVFIDLVDLLGQMGVDVFQRLDDAGARC